MRKGVFLLSGGSLKVDILIVTNPCAHLIKNGGTLVYNQLILDPSQSAADDGIPNNWKQQHGFDPFDASVAGADPDNDGRDNLSEYLAGTDPLDPASVFQLISITKINTRDIRVDWATVGGHNYVVQLLTNSSGTLTGTFVDLSGLIPVGGAGPGTASYIHLNGATNRASYYRVRLIP